MKCIAGMKIVSLIVVLFGVMAVPVTQAAEIGACVITKTDTNPFFVKMKEGALAKAGEYKIKLQTFAGKIDGDTETQVAAVETCIASGAKGILITPSDSKALVPVIQQAREAGLLVIALDTPLEPADAADATFATDNFKAGELIGQWANAKLGADAAKAKIALLDLNAQEVSVDYLRDNGFLKGFGIDIKDPTDIGDEDDPRIVGHDVTNGNEEGAARPWRTCSRKTRRSMWSTPLMSPQQPVPMKPSRRLAGKRMCSSCRSMAAVRACKTSKTAFSGRPRCSFRC